MGSPADAIEPGTKRKVTELAERTVAQRWPGSRLATMSVVPGDASSRRYVRYSIEAGANRDAPGSLIAMILDEESGRRSSSESGDSTAARRSELSFVNLTRFLSGLTDAAPEIYAVGADESVLLLEDVGDRTLWDAASAPGADTEALFGRALDLIADLQARATDDGSGCYAFRRHFDRKPIASELQEFLTFGVELPDPAIKSVTAELDALCDSLDRLPRVFAHRDYHAWNIHMVGERVRFFDHQDALMAPALYDVASLLTDRRTPELVDDAMEQRLVARFVEHQRAGSVGDLEATRKAYRAVAAQRVLKVVGRFNQLADVRKKTAYRDMLSSIVPAARRLVGRVPELTHTARALDDAVRPASLRQA